MPTLKKSFIRFSRKIFGISNTPKRKSFKPETKNLIWRRQQGCCNDCGRGLMKGEYDYDHKRGRSDNSPDNCQILCVLCHRQKSNYDRRKKKHNY